LKAATATDTAASNRSSTTAGSYTSKPSPSSSLLSKANSGSTHDGQTLHWPSSSTQAYPYPHRPIQQHRPQSSRSSQSQRRNLETTEMRAAPQPAQESEIEPQGRTGSPFALKTESDSMPLSNPTTAAATTTTKSSPNHGVKLPDASKTNTIPASTIAFAVSGDGHAYQASLLPSDPTTLDTPLTGFSRDKYDQNEFCNDHADLIAHIPVADRHLLAGVGPHTIVPSLQHIAMSFSPSIQAVVRRISTALTPAAAHKPRYELITREVQALRARKASEIVTRALSSTTQHHAMSSAFLAWRFVTRHNKAVQEHKQHLEQINKARSNNRDVWKTLKVAFTSWRMGVRISKLQHRWTHQIHALQFHLRDLQAQIKQNNSGNSPLNEDAALTQLQALRSTVLSIKKLQCAVPLRIFGASSDLCHIILQEAEDNLMFISQSAKSAHSSTFSTRHNSCTLNRLSSSWRERESQNIRSHFDEINRLLAIRSKRHGFSTKDNKNKAEANAPQTFMASWCEHEAATASPVSNALDPSFHKAADPAEQEIARVERLMSGSPFSLVERLHALAEQEKGQGHQAFEDIVQMSIDELMQTFLHNMRSCHVYQQHGAADEQNANSMPKNAMMYRLQHASSKRNLTPGTRSPRRAALFASGDQSDILSRPKKNVAKQHNQSQVFSVSSSESKVHSRGCRVRFDEAATSHAHRKNIQSNMPKAAKPLQPQLPGLYWDYAWPQRCIDIGLSVARHALSLACVTENGSNSATSSARRYSSAASTPAAKLATIDAILACANPVHRALQGVEWISQFWNKEATAHFSEHPYYEISMHSATAAFKANMFLCGVMETAASYYPTPVDSMWIRTSSERLHHLRKSWENMLHTRDISPLQAYEFLEEMEIFAFSIQLNMERIERHRSVVRQVQQRVRLHALHLATMLDSTMNVLSLKNPSIARLYDGGPRSQVTASTTKVRMSASSDSGSSSSRSRQIRAAKKTSIYATSLYDLHYASPTITNLRVRGIHLDWSSSPHLKHLLQQLCSSEGGDQYITSELQRIQIVLDEHMHALWSIFTAACIGTQSGPECDSSSTNAAPAPTAAGPVTGSNAHRPNRVQSAQLLTAKHNLHLNHLACVDLLHQCGILSQSSAHIRKKHEHQAAITAAALAAASGDTDAANVIKLSLQQNEDTNQDSPHSRLNAFDMLCEEAILLSQSSLESIRDNLAAPTLNEQVAGVPYGNSLVEKGVFELVDTDRSRLNVFDVWANQLDMSCVDTRTDDEELNVDEITGIVLHVSRRAAPTLRLSGVFRRDNEDAECDSSDNSDSESGSESDDGINTHATAFVSKSRGVAFSTPSTAERRNSIVSSVAMNAVWQNGRASSASLAERSYVPSSTSNPLASASVKQARRSTRAMRDFVEVRKSSPWRPVRVATADQGAHADMKSEWSNLAWPHFVEMLVRIAAMRYTRLEHIADRLHMLLLRDILPHASRLPVDDFRNQLASAEMIVVLERHAEVLEQAFDVLAAQSIIRSGAHSGAKGVSLSKFTRFCWTVGLTNGREIATVFENAHHDHHETKSADQDDDDNAFPPLTFLEFVEALCAISLWVIRLPFLSPSSRFGRFISHHVIPKLDLF
jgi:hypothetical protein